MTPQEIWNNAWKCLNNDKEGFAIKKMIAAGFCFIVAVLVFEYTDKDNFLSVLAQLLGFIIVVLGIRKLEKQDALKAEVEKTGKGKNDGEG